jgi:hypothetical protein
MPLANDPLAFIMSAETCNAEIQNKIESPEHNSGDAHNQLSNNCNNISGISKNSRMIASCICLLRARLCGGESNGGGERYIIPNVNKTICTTNKGGI